MGFLKSLFTGREQTPEEKKKEADDKQFDMFKYDGIRAARMGRHDYAVKCLREALKIRDDSETRHYLWQSLVNTEAFDDALEQLGVLHQAAPADESVMMSMAMVAYMKEDYDTMATVCAEAMERGCLTPQVYYRNAQALMGKGEGDAALAQIDKAIEGEPHYAAALLLRGRWLLMRGDVKGATADADALLALDAADEDALMLKARAEQAAGNTDAAIDAYGQVVDANPFNADAYKERAALREQEGDAEGAREDRQKLSELNPDEAADVSSEHSVEGVEYKVKKVMSDTNPLGI